MDPQIKVSDHAANDHSIFQGGGEMGALMESFAWSKSPLGPPESWSPTLQAVTRMLLANGFPLLLCWGPDFHQIYNDAYIPILGNEHHSAALGRPFRDCWAEFHHVLGPLAQKPFEGGEATLVEDFVLELDRFGYLEEAHFTIGFSAVPDPLAPRGVGGVLASVHEITEKSLLKRRLAGIRALSNCKADTSSLEEACAMGVSVLGRCCRLDVPFALIYLNDGTNQARLVAETGVGEFSLLRPERLNLTRESSGPWPLALCRRQNGPVLVEKLQSIVGRVPAGPWPDPPTTAVTLPIHSAVPGQPAGFLVAGLSPRLRFDEAYRGFLELYASHISGMLALAERKHHQEELSRLAAIVSSADDAIISKDLKGVIRTWNDAATKMFGYAAEETIGRSILMLIPDDLWSEEDQILAKLSAGERIDHYETVRKKKSGEPIEVSITISPIRDEAGTVIGASKIARDISDRRRVERLLIQSEKLSASGRMAASVAHEINNPLESLINLIYLARRTADPESKVHGYLVTAEGELDRVAHLARQTLGYYRDTSAPAELALRDVIENVLTVYRSRLMTGAITVDAHFNDTPPILAKKGELLQVFSNIIANAIDSMSPGGTLYIATRKVISPKGDGLEVSLRDTGVGIQREALPRVFEPFFTTKGERGSGIGLWVSRQLVEARGGHISVASKVDAPDSGTTFTVFLPFALPT